MRQIGRLPNETQAEALGDYLFVQKIENTLHSESDGNYSIWVHDDEELDKAKEAFAKFLLNPGDVVYQQAIAQARFLRGKQRREEKKSRAKTVDIRTSWHMARNRISRLTLILILVSVGVSLLSQLGRDTSVIQPLFIADFTVTGGYIQWRAGLYEVMHGQVWRLITPIFIHFGLLHLLFNMLWLKDLGSMIESHQGTWILGIQVLVIGIFSNVGQYFWSGPSFGGMSGVVYGLLGYVWMRGKFDPGSGLFLHRTIVVWMLAWLALCFTGLIGNVANVAHTVGLLVGLAWGYLSSGHLLRLIKR